MNQATFLVHSIFILCSASFFCHKTFAEPQNITLLKQELIHYHDSGAYNQEIVAVTQNAENYLIEASKEPSQKPLALVLDIDETCLSNYENIVKRGFDSDDKKIHQHILKADASVIKPCQKLYNLALKNHIDVFISGRYENERLATIKNLEQTGFKGWKNLYLQPNSNFGKSNTIEQFKIQSRKEITNQGYRIIASVGDQYVDLNGGYAEKTFKIPNPFYYSGKKS